MGRAGKSHVHPTVLLPAFLLVAQMPTAAPGSVPPGEVAHSQEPRQTSELWPGAVVAALQGSCRVMLVVASLVGGTSAPQRHRHSWLHIASSGQPVLWSGCSPPNSTTTTARIPTRAPGHLLPLLTDQERWQVARSPGGHPSHSQEHQQWCFRATVGGAGGASQERRRKSW